MRQETNFELFISHSPLWVWQGLVRSGLLDLFFDVDFDAILPAGLAFNEIYKTKNGRMQYRLILRNAENEINCFMMEAVAVGGYSFARRTLNRRLITTKPSTLNLFLQPCNQGTLLKLDYKGTFKWKLFCKGCITHHGAKRFYMERLCLSMKYAKKRNFKNVEKIHDEVSIPFEIRE